VLFGLPGVVFGAVAGAPLNGLGVALALYAVWAMLVWRADNYDAVAFSSSPCAPARHRSMTGPAYRQQRPLSIVVVDGGNSIAPQMGRQRVQPQMVRLEPIIVGREALPQPETEAESQAESQGAPVWLVAEDEPEPAVVAVGCRPSRWDYLEIR
jgi:hypothetical protein